MGSYRPKVRVRSQSTKVNKAEKDLALQAELKSEQDNLDRLKSEQAAQVKAQQEALEASQYSPIKFEKRSKQSKASGKKKRSTILTDSLGDINTSDQVTRKTLLGL